MFAARTRIAFVTLVTYAVALRKTSILSEGDDICSQIVSGSTKRVSAWRRYYSGLTCKCDSGLRVTGNDEACKSITENLNTHGKQVFDPSPLKGKGCACGLPNVERKVHAQHEEETLTAKPVATFLTTAAPMEGLEELITAAENLVSVMGQKAEAAQQGLVDALGNLNDFEFKVGQENNTRADAADVATDALLRASQDSALAEKAKQSVLRMAESCSLLFEHVNEFKSGSEPRAAFQRALTKETLSHDIDRLSEEVVATERLELGNILKLIQDILDAKEEVERLDQQVGAGAAEGIQKATLLVQGYAMQLKQRQDMLTSAQAFAKFPPLQPTNAILAIDKAILGSLDKAIKKIDQIVKAKDSIYRSSVQQVSKLAASGKQSNATTMKDMIQDMKSAGKAKAVALALGSAVEKSMQAIENFFSVLESYKSAEADRKMIASKEVDALVLKAEQVRQSIDETVLLETTTFFQLYAIMWGRTSEVERAVSEHEDPVFAKLGRKAHAYAISVHEWINGELYSLCDHHESCMKVRSLVFAIVEQKVNYCDERFTQLFCATHHAGFAPSGRTCKWIPPQPELGIRGECKSVRPPTRGLKFHQDHKDGAGIFY